MTRSRGYPTTTDTGPATLSAMPLDENQSELINARISRSLLLKLDACAAAESRSRSQMVRRMIEEGVGARAGVLRDWADMWREEDGKP
jgi:hypothetical protein